MKHSKILRVLLSLLLLSITACESESPPSRAPYNSDSYPAINASNHTGKKIALVMGNWAYRFNPLKNPKNDARKMTILLRQLGFDVIHKENLGFEEMEDEIIKFKVKLKQDGQVGLFYFAGHGLEVEGRNYLLPTDLRVPETKLITRKSIQAQWVVDVMEDSGSKVNIAILDACRSFPRPDIPRATSNDYGLSAMNAPVGTIISFATGSGKTASDGKNGNGLYTGHLLKFMQQAGLSIEEVFKKTRQQVAMETGNRQVPPVYNSLIGDFCLVSCEKPKPDKEKILQAQVDVLQHQLKTLKDHTQPVVPKYDKFEPGKVFRDRLRDGSRGPEMVFNPAGSFRMGDIQGSEDSDEKPERLVSVGAFAMGKYEVTVGEYLRFVKDTGKHAPEWMEKGSSYNIKTGSDNYYKKFGSALTSKDYPVVGVSWHDAVAYTEWLSQETGYIYRLPTEAEWEYAARAGTETKYWWGNKIGSNKANCNNDYCGDSFEYTAPVGSFGANQFGISDTVGNVWEWVSDIYGKDYYSSSPRSNPKGPRGDETGRQLRVFRGGAWSNTAQHARAANRDDYSPNGRNGNVGFRLVR